MHSSKPAIPLRLISLAAFSGIVMGLLVTRPALAQTPAPANFIPLEFVENKGQWTGDFLYRTDLGGSAIYLKKNGFTFKLFNKEDMEQIRESMHGRRTGASGSQPPTVIYDANKTTAPAQTAAALPTQPAQPPADNGQPVKPPAVLRSHSYEVSFLNANLNPQIVPDKALESYSNYFIGNNSANWRSGVKSYQTILYKGLYKGIDMQVYSEASMLKYDLVVYPGADPDMIQLQYTGVDKLTLQKGELQVTTSVGTATEMVPYAYQFIGNQRVPVKVSYQLKGMKLGFKVSGKYDPQYPLVIDPTYIFSTVTGARSDNWGYTATYDAQGNFYGGGILFSPGQYPITPGAAQSAYQGGEFDIAISKFDPTGRRLLYSTFIGGNGIEQPHSLFADSQGSLVISGRTNSGDFPFTNTAGVRGGWDIAVVKLNPTGTAITGALCVAGRADDGVNMRDSKEGGAVVLLRNYGDDARSEVVLDAQDNIYVASSTRSSDFPVTAGAFQTGFGGAQDAVVMRINPSCTGLVWASYLGGSKEDGAYVLAINGNNLYVAGGTASSNFRTTGGSIYPTYRGGACDGFITHLTADGASVLQSTYMGADNAAADQVYGIQLDAGGNVYVMGTTEGNWPIRRPIGTATFYNDNSKQFIAKLQPNLSAFIYSTTFGKQASTPSISPVAFLVDKCENVYISGWGGGLNIGYEYPNSGTTGLPVKNALQGKTDDEDFYFFVMQRDATDVLFASFFGGVKLFEHVDGGTSRFDRNGVIYQGICAWCKIDAPQQPAYPITPGAYSNTPPFTDCNLGALKIAFNLDGVKAGIKTLDRKKNYCIPADVTFVDTTSSKATTRTWSFGDGSPVVTGNLDTVSHTYNRLGDFTVRLVKCDPASCNGCDTAYTEVRIRADSAHVDLAVTRIPPCQSLAYEFNNNSVAPAIKPFQSNSFTLDYGDGTPVATLGAPATLQHAYQDAGIYNAVLTLVDTNYCNAPHADTVPLRVAANVVAKFETPDVLCAPATVTFNNTTEGGETFTWDFGDGSPTSNEAYPTHVYQNPGTYQVKLHAVDNNTCNIQDDFTKSITVEGPPTAQFTSSPDKPQENVPISFVNQSMGGSTYLWDFGDGIVSTETNPVHQYNKTGTYNACLTVTNAAGCKDTVCQEVSAIVIPLFDVPNAFSPNGDGMNDVMLVRGFGIARFNMKIFNRWGQLVFESNDPTIGWDGKFKGAVQPMDAYAYTVYVEFSDGTKTNKNGSVTLLK